MYRRFLVVFTALGWILGQGISLPIAIADDEAKTNLGVLRQQIDSLDDQILKFLNDRAKVVKKIGLIKEKHHLPIRVPKREEEVIKRLQDQNRGPLPAPAIRRLWEQIMAEMRSIEASK